VVLNSADIDVSFASFTSPDGVETQAKEISYNKEEEKVILTFPQNLPTGWYFLFEFALHYKRAIDMRDYYGQFVSFAVEFVLGFFRLSPYLHQNMSLVDVVQLHDIESSGAIARHCVLGRQTVDPAWQKSCKQNRSIWVWYDRHGAVWLIRERKRAKTT